MFGIVAYIGNKQAFPIVVKGLKRLEHRCYECGGVAVTLTRPEILRRV